MRCTGPRCTLLVTLLLVAAVAHAKAWNGIEPGVSRRDDVVKRFGPPSKTLTVSGKEVLAYTDSAAMKGTSQAQFRVDPPTGVVDRIDVFPATVIDHETVEATFGPSCPKTAPPQPAACFQKKLTDDFRTYYLYSRIGLAVFFEENEDKVQSFVYTAPRPAPAAAPAA
ncbi:MAG TPA: hypothetical protein VFD38_07305, partial [Myxococcaceae bacterium]|nr:hypothetical protein [Myxococcaceae bacterium]